MPPTQTLIPSPLNILETFRKSLQKGSKTKMEYPELKIVAEGLLAADEYYGSYPTPESFLSNTEIKSRYKECYYMFQDAYLRPPSKTKQIFLDCEFIDSLSTIETHLLKGIQLIKKTYVNVKSSLQTSFSKLTKCLKSLSGRLFIRLSHQAKSKSQKQDLLALYKTNRKTHNIQSTKRFIYKIIPSNLIKDQSWMDLHITISIDSSDPSLQPLLHSYNQAFAEKNTRLSLPKLHKLVNNPQFETYFPILTIHTLLQIRKHLFLSTQTEERNQAATAIHRAYNLSKILPTTHDLRLLMLEKYLGALIRNKSEEIAGILSETFSSLSSLDDLSHPYIISIFFQLANAEFSGNFNFNNIDGGLTMTFSELLLRIMRHPDFPYNSEEILFYLIRMALILAYSNERRIDDAIGIANEGIAHLQLARDSCKQLTNEDYSLIHMEHRFKMILFRCASRYNFIDSVQYFFQDWFEACYHFILFREKYTDSDPPLFFRLIPDFEVISAHILHILFHQNKVVIQPDRLKSFRSFVLNSLTISNPTSTINIWSLFVLGCIQLQSQLPPTDWIGVVSIPNSSSLDPLEDFFNEFSNFTPSSVSNKDIIDSTKYPIMPSIQKSYHCHAIQRYQDIIQVLTEKDTILQETPLDQVDYISKWFETIPVSIDLFKQIIFIISWFTKNNQIPLGNCPYNFLPDLFSRMLYESARIPSL